MILASLNSIFKIWIHSVIYLIFQPQIIARHGYPSESHIIVTEDGYLLQLHRIPCSKSKKCGPPVFLQHGLLGSSADWVINGNNSLGKYTTQLWKISN